MKLRPLTATLAAGLLLPAGIASSALAQRMSGPDRVVPDEVVAQRVTNLYAQCILRRHRSAAERFVSLPLDSPDLREAGMAVAQSECLPAEQARFVSSLLRGAVFEALYLRDFRRSSVGVLASAPPLTFASDPATLEPAKRAIFLGSRVAECTVRADPASARALILSPVASRTEARAFDAILPAVSGCLEAGAQLSFSRPMLRGLIAESLYRLTKISADSSRRQ